MDAVLASGAGHRSARPRRRGRGFSVLLGELAETFRYPTGPIRSQLHITGSSLGFGAGRAHQVQNLGPGKAASVHAYSPPLVPTGQYASLRDIRGRRALRRRTEKASLLAEAEQKYSDPGAAASASTG